MSLPDEAPVLGPAHARTQSVEALTPARRVVLDVLGTRDGAATVADVAEETCLHLNTVREHLEALVELGLATRGRLSPQGRGRPASTYEYSPQADTLSPGYGLMTNAIVDYLALTFGNTEEVGRHAYQAGRKWGEEVVARGLLTRGEDEVQTPREATLAFLDEAGFEPTLHEQPEPSVDVPIAGPEIRLARCPVLTMARAYPQLMCQAHLGMVDECLTSQRPGKKDVQGRTRMEAFVNEGYCSLFLNVPDEAAGLAVGDSPS